MSDDEIFVSIAAAIVALWASVATSVSGLHPLCLHRNPGPGLVRLAVIGNMVWLGIVLRFFGDPSIVGIYVGFYFLLGYAVTKFFGQVLYADSFRDRNAARDRLWLVGERQARWRSVERPDACSCLFPVVRVACVRPVRI